MILAIHLRRPRHRRLMTEASIQVAASKAQVYRAKRDDPAEGMKGWARIQMAIRTVVECGCPREQWPTNVQEAIPDV